VTLELPESVIEQETLSVLRRLLSAYRDRRVPPEAVESLKAEARGQAVEHLRNHLILERIAQKRASRWGRRRSRRSAAGPRPTTFSRASWEMIRRDEHRREEMAENLLFRKTVDFLMKTSIIG
jgi:FKBP-type peptidyl-prolyl cis-trans isomerase (trigger factor)